MRGGGGQLVSAQPSGTLASGLAPASRSSSNVHGWRVSPMATDSQDSNTQQRSRCAAANPSPTQSVPIPAGAVDHLQRRVLRGSLNPLHLLPSNSAILTSSCGTPDDACLGVVSAQPHPPCPPSGSAQTSRGNAISTCDLCSRIRGPRGVHLAGGHRSAHTRNRQRRCDYTLAVKVLTAGSRDKSHSSALMRFASLSTALNVSAAVGPIRREYSLLEFLSPLRVWFSSLAYALACLVACGISLGDDHLGSTRPRWTSGIRHSLRTPEFRRALNFTAFGWLLYSQLTPCSLCSFASSRTRPEFVGGIWPPTRSR